MIHSLVFPTPDREGAAVLSPEVAPESITFVLGEDSEQWRKGQILWKVGEVEHVVAKLPKLQGQCDGSVTWKVDSCAVTEVT